MNKSLYLPVTEAMKRFELTAEQLAHRDLNNYYTGSGFRKEKTHKKGKASESEMTYSKTIKNHTKE